MSQRSGQICACGCGRQCSQKRNTWATPRCVPRVSRQANGRKARRTYAVKARTAKFQAEVARIVAGGGRIRHEDLLAILMTAYTQGYSAGLMTGLRRVRSAERAA
jgi:hypothetical protein